MSAIGSSDFKFPGNNTQATAMSGSRGVGKSPLPIGKDGWIIDDDWEVVELPPVSTTAAKTDALKSTIDSAVGEAPLATALSKLHPQPFGGVPAVHSLSAVQPASELAGPVAHFAFVIEAGAQIKDVLPKLPADLKSVKIMVDLDYEELCALGKACPLLESMSLHKVGGGIDFAFFPQLKCMDVTDTSDIFEFSLINLDKCTQLEELTFQHAWKMIANNLVKQLPPSLKKLQLSGLFTGQFSANPGPREVAIDELRSLLAASPIGKVTSITVEEQPQNSFMITFKPRKIIQGSLCR